MKKLEIQIPMTNRSGAVLKKNNKNSSLISLTSLIAASLLLLILSGCGGGLGGSGDGGDPGRDSNTSTLPGYLEDPYLIKSVPERMIARIPSSLAETDEPQTTTDSPYEKLSATIGELVNHKLEVGLLLLHLDANWEKISAHCADAPIDTTCSLEGETFSTLYTLEMAAWEFELRATITQELTGSDGTLTESESLILEDLVTEKIGTDLIVQGGTYFRQSSIGYTHQVVIPLNLGFGDTIYNLRWSDNRAEAYLSLLRNTENRALLLKTTMSEATNSSGQVNSVLISSAETELRVERQLNLNQLTANRELLIESQHTEIAGSTKNDTYSIGNASNLGGYLKSELTTRDSMDTTSTNFRREVFSSQAQIEASAFCAKETSDNQCQTDDSWTTTTSNDPAQSQFFFSAEQLAQLENRLKPFDIEFQGVSGDMDTLILIKRDNLSISFSSEGIILSIPGLGKFNLTGESTATELADNIDPSTSTSQLTILADSILCRVNKGIVDNQLDWRSFCAGTTEEIENALVVGESFKAGELLIEWQANAVIDVISR